MDTMRTLRILSLFILMLGGVSVSTKTQAQPGFSINFQTFYDELSPYGRWTRNPQYGSVWIPDVPRGFQPYSTSGYWEVTEYGNTWVSEYDWGWAPFHYGRWSYDDYNGWFWIPDYEWGPAWVNWRSGGGYYGWAPLGPGVNINVSINIPSFWWVFVPQRYITSPRWHSYCAPPRRVSHYYNNTVIINNYYRSNNRTYVYGPRRDEIERVTRRSVPVRTIDASPRGRGRVIIADRGNGRYDYGTRDNDRGGRTVDANPRIDRSNRNDDNRIERGDNSRRGSRNPFDERNNGRSERNRESTPIDGRSDRNETPNPSRNDRYEAPNPSRNDRNEAPNRSERNRDFGNPGNSPERTNRPERVERPNIERPERVERSNRTPESPSPRVERQERSAPEPRSNDRGNRGGDNGGSRSSDNGGNRGGGSSERSGRGPR
ncbi:hypothetical protein LZD49_28770 [Dyadobacter sp. CY261]|uniref:DUF6600 domain-containing protein n=1 Tax=Dyadobacter sp. CY261 TaxID=2907203 RepID=UPI001F1E9DF9|nr:DUF6600 domain-containing protein [Dyadobacter sp. CY261]MCF0074513.1 hypothetical protein [Dyadobacter sp. CY261]